MISKSSIALLFLALTSSVNAAAIADQFARREAGGLQDFPSPVPTIFERAPVVDSIEKRVVSIVQGTGRRPKIVGDDERRRAPKGIKKPPKPAPKPATKPATRPATNLALNTATDSATSSASATTTVSAVA